MMMTKNYRKILYSAVMLIFTAIFCSPVQACSVPVFRYALERWSADPYLVTVFYKGKLSKEQEKVIKYFRKFGDEQDIIFSLFNLDNAKLPEEAVKYWKAHKQSKLPVVLVGYPYPSGLKQLAGVYPLDMNSAKQLMESPSGREIARRLLKDDSAVYMLIDCNDEKLNRKAEKTARDALKKLNKEFSTYNADGKSNKDTEQTDESAEETQTFKVQFSFLRVSRKNKADKALIDILLNTEDDLKKVKTPILFPVYGRGRALFAFYNDGISEENITDAADFLTGECSCEIKAQNPGIDMLIPVNWDEFLYYEIDIDDELPPLTGLHTVAAEKKKAETLPEPMNLKKIAEEKDTGTTADGNRLILNIILASLILLALVAVASVSLRNKGPK